MFRPEVYTNYFSNITNRVEVKSGHEKARIDAHWSGADQDNSLKYLNILDNGLLS